MISTRSKWYSQSFLFVASGRIEHLNYEENEYRTWPVYSDCESVWVRSTSFDTQYYYDTVRVGETEYSGSIQIYTVMPSNFTVIFHSDGSTRSNGNGFELEWDCLQWGEWGEWADDGTCREVMTLVPEYNGTDTGWYKYRETNDTCSKFINFYLAILKLCRSNACTVIRPSKSDDLIQTSFLNKKMRSKR